MVQSLQCASLAQGRELVRCGFSLPPYKVTVKKYKSSRTVFSLNECLGYLHVLFIPDVSVNPIVFCWDKSRSSVVLPLPVSTCVIVVSAG